VTSALATSEWAGRAVWVERRLFEVVGAWVPTMTDDEATVAVATLSRRHAWRAELLAELLSTYGGTARADHVACPDPAVESALSFLAELGSDVERLAGLARSVLPGLVVAHDRFLSASSPVSGASAARLVSVARDDLAADRRHAEANLQRLGSSADLTAALSAVELLDGRIADAGGILGQH
jgi:hypothetical protein